MHNISLGRLLTIFIVGMMATASCTQTYSQAPLATPTLISTGLFVSPFPSGQDPLQIDDGQGINARKGLVQKQEFWPEGERPADL